MKKFTVHDEIFEIFPEACFGVVVASGVNNASADSAVYEELLRAAEKASEKHTALEPLSQNQAVAVWRDAYQKFKTKKGARASVEAMLKRVKQGGHIGCISPVVDIYNSVSLTYGVPVGAEDIDAFVGDLRLAMADGTEEFYLIGSDENEPPSVGEIVYKDDAGAVCRCFNWRDGKRTMVTENSVNVFSIIEMVDKTRLPELEEAISVLAGLYEKHLGAKVEKCILDKGKNWTEIG